MPPPRQRHCCASDDGGARLAPRDARESRCSLLLPDDLREKLRQTLAAVPEWPRDTIWQTVQEQGDDRTALQGRLATIWKALREKHQLAYANRDSSGKIHEGICSPCRLEYDAAANCYYLIIWQPDEARAIKMRVARLASVQCLDAPIPRGYRGSLPSFSRGPPPERDLAHRASEQRRRAQLHDVRELRQRSQLRRGGRHLHHTALLLRFRSREILQQILSLGAAATVLAPADMREAIIERLQAAWQNLQ